MTTPVMTPRGEREQHAFRELLAGMSRPGTVRRIEVTAGANRPAAITLLESLLDHEVSFAVSPPNPETEEMILRVTGAHHADVRVADYILAEGDGIADAIGSANEGKPEYPDWGATVIAVVDSVSETPGDGEKLVLSGPGILDRQRTWISGLPAAARDSFRERNREVPLGIDLVLIAPDGAFTCLPRYTQIQEER